MSFQRQNPLIRFYNRITSPNQTTIMSSHALEVVQPVVTEKSTLMVGRGDSDVSSSNTATPQEVESSKIVREWVLRGIIGILVCFLVFEFLLPLVVAASILVFRLCISYAEEWWYGDQNDGDLGRDHWRWWPCSFSLDSKINLQFEWGKLTIRVSRELISMPLCNSTKKSLYNLNWSVTIFTSSRNKHWLQRPQKLPYWLRRQIRWLQKLPYSLQRLPYWLQQTLLWLQQLIPELQRLPRL